MTGLVKQFNDIIQDGRHLVLITKFNILKRKHKLNLNMHGKDGDSKTNGRKSKERKESLDLEFKGPRVIVFVIGGMTYSEMRCLHKVMKETKREVIIGSTHITTQKTFLNEVLNKLGTDAHDKSMSALDEINLDNLDV